jgi:O-antigen/teichoic acid export membrane protein
MTCLIFFMVSAAISQSLFAEGSNSPEVLQTRVRSSVRLIALILGPCMFVFLVGGGRILSLFGPRYASEGSELLILLTISAIPDAVTNVYVAVLRVQRRLRFASVLNGSMAAITLSLSWLLLPSLGIVGAGWAWLIAQTAGSCAVAVDRYARGRVKSQTEIRVSTP